MSRVAKVHLNLPMTAKAGHAVYAVKYNGQPVFYARSVTMRDCRFVIDKRLREQFEARPSRRTVHAHVKGIVVSTDDARPLGTDAAQSLPVQCNPFLYNCFVETASMKKALSADVVALHTNKTIEALNVVTDDSPIHASLTRQVRR